MTPVNAGTPKPGSYFTEEQLVALETLKQPGLELGAARAEFVNKVLLPDGSMSSDIDAVVSAAQARVPAILGGDTSNPAVLRAAADAAAKVQEIHAHIGEERFLFVVDQEQVPVIYFQCAVPGNPDVR